MYGRGICLGFHGPTWSILIYSIWSRTRLRSGQSFRASPTKIFHVLFCLFVCINWPMRHLYIIWITLGGHVMGSTNTFNNKDLVYIRMFVCLLLIIEFWNMTTYEKLKSFETYKPKLLRQTTDSACRRNWLTAMAPHQTLRYCTVPLSNFRRHTHTHVLFVLL